MNGRQGIHDFGHCGGYAARRRIGSFPGWSPAMSRSLVLLLAGLLSPVSLLAADPPREVAGRIAATIENEYFDPAAGTRIAGELRRASDNGAFDRLQDPRELATALSDRLRPLDRHFVVRWSPPGTEPPGPQRGPVRDPATSNFGIRRVQLLPGNIGYLELGYFADIDFDDPAAPARVAIDAALQLLAHADAVVVDVRDNGGGSPAMVGYLASAFVAPGAKIYNTFRWREGGASEAPGYEHPAPRTTVPLYVLTSGRTGSAAEAFAYTLGNAGRAVLVGEATGGAANPGRPFDVGGGFSVFVSTGSPVSPITGRNWEGSGVQPQVEVEAAEALVRAQELALARLVADGGGDQGASWVLEALRSRAPAPDPATVQVLAGEYGTLRIEALSDGLQLRQGRRPPQRLRALDAAGLFYFESDPARRLRFDRGANGVPVALELVWPEGEVVRHVRGQAAD